ncbi:MAG: hypothetical protein ABF289_12545 [Clostridiales bacterium]
MKKVIAMRNQNKISARSKMNPEELESLETTTLGTASFTETLSFK